MQKIESKKSLNTKIKAAKKPLLEGSDSESHGEAVPIAIEDKGVEYQNIASSKK